MQQTADSEDEEVIVPAIQDEFTNPSMVVLCVNMIGRGCEAIDEIKYTVQDYGQRNNIYKNLLIDQYINLIAILAYDGLSTSQDPSRVMVMYELMTINVEGILNNYHLKAYPKEKVSILHMHDTLII